MSHIVSLHFEDPFEDGPLETKLEAVDGIPIASGDHVEIVGIWQNEDGSVGIHVEVIEKPTPANSTEAPKNKVNNQTQDAEPEAEPANSKAQDENDDIESLNEVDPDQEVVERAPHDDITKADNRIDAEDEALALTATMQKADDELEEDFDLAAEGQLSKLELERKLKKEIEDSYDQQKEIQGTPDPSGPDDI